MAGHPLEGREEEETKSGQPALQGYECVGIIFGDISTLQSPSGSIDILSLGENVSPSGT